MAAAPPLTVIPTIILTGDPAVFNGFRYIISPENDKRKFTTTGQFEAACNTLYPGSEPVSILSAAEHSYLATFTRSNTTNNELWVGARYSGGSLSWMDGSTGTVYDIFLGQTPSGKNTCVLYNNFEADNTPSGLFELARCSRTR
jgi:hypothetical protein